MKSIAKALLGIALLFVALCGLSADAQNVSDIYLVGGTYNPAASPKGAVTGLYGHAVSPDTTKGMYAITVVDALPAGDKSFTTNVGVGIAQRVATIAGHDVFVPTGVSLSTTGSAVGWGWSTGAGVSFQVKENWYVMPTVRVLKAGDAGYQPIVSVLFGWGK